MIFGIGTDAVKLSRVERLWEQYGDRFARRILLDEEYRLLRPQHRPVRFLAMRFAAKEASFKALGTGTQGISWHNVVVERDALGAPRIRLLGRAAERAQTLRLNHWALSLTHDGDYAS